MYSIPKLLPLLLSTACAMLPTPLPAPPRQTYLADKDFRLAVLDFGTGTTQRTGPTMATPARLLTQLYHAQPRRFALFDGGSLRAGGPITEENAHKFVDAYLTGTLTSGDRDSPCFDIRIANAVSHELLYSYGTRFCPGSGGDFSALVNHIHLQIGTPSYAEVSSVQGRRVTINSGREQQVRSGMMALVLAAGDTVYGRQGGYREAGMGDRERHKRLENAGKRGDALRQLVQDYTAVNPQYLPLGPEYPVETTRRIEEVVGEIYIASVEKDYSIGVLFNGDYVLPGDLVRFK